MYRSTDAPSQAIAKIAVLASVFEKLVAESGTRRGRIEQLLAEIEEERDDACVIAVDRRAA
jgi:hypothetical protein